MINTKHTSNLYIRIQKDLPKFNKDSIAKASDLLDNYRKADPGHAKDFCFKELLNFAKKDESLKYVLWEGGSPGHFENVEKTINKISAIIAHGKSELGIVEYTDNSPPEGYAEDLAESSHNGVTENISTAYTGDVSKLDGKQLDAADGITSSELREIEPKHWQKLSEVACKVVVEGKSGMFKNSPHLQKQNIRPNLNFAFRTAFYKEIWETHSTNKVNYKFTEPDASVRAKQWTSIVQSVQENSSNLPQAKALQNGKAWIQTDGGGQDVMKNARLQRMYTNDGGTASRAQCVAERDAGIGLYVAMGEAIDSYIANECNGDQSQCPVGMYKVFGEDAQVGRSDSSVLYLNKTVDHPDTQKLINNYLNPALGDRLASVRLIGMVSSEDGKISAANIPPEKLQKKVLGDTSKDSHGALMRLVLAESYSRAINGLEEQRIPLTPEALTKAAKVHTQEVWQELGMAN